MLNDIRLFIDMIDLSASEGKRPMNKSVIVIGARGRFGRAATQSFHSNGWDVRAFARNAGDCERKNIEWIEGDAFDRTAIEKACEGMDVIVNALNPPYERWEADLPILTANIITAAQKSRATVMIPGNVYNYGMNISPLISEQNLHKPHTKKGRLRVEMERSYMQASVNGVRTIVLRAGDFIEREKTGNWFDSHIAPKALSGKFTYPGPLDLKHAWAYLPDMARAMVMLAEERHRFEPFEEFGFSGWGLTGAELVAKIESVTGVPQKVGQLPWAIIKMISVFSPRIKEVLEMRYLWQVAHEIDGSKLRDAIPQFEPTPLEQALGNVLEIRTSATGQEKTARVTA